jgi:hypothetical protein
MSEDSCHPVVTVEITILGFPTASNMGAISHGKEDFPIKIIHL